MDYLADDFKSIRERAEQIKREEAIHKGRRAFAKITLDPKENSGKFIWEWFQHNRDMLATCASPSQVYCDGDGERSIGDFVPCYYQLGDFLRWMMRAYWPARQTIAASPLVKAGAGATIERRDGRIGNVKIILCRMAVLDVITVQP